MRPALRIEQFSGPGGHGSSPSVRDALKRCVARELDVVVVSGHSGAMEPVVAGLLGRESPAAPETRRLTLRTAGSEAAFVRNYPPHTDGLLERAIPRCVSLSFSVTDEPGFGDSLFWSSESVVDRLPPESLRALQETPVRFFIPDRMGHPWDRL